jgi:pyruvate dehydrogenase E2 component (dihydrolipoamide acetyltransferase)
MALKPVKPEFEDRPLSPVRKAIADRVAASARELPVFHLHAEVDATGLLAARVAAKREAQGARAPSHNDFIIKAVATVLPRHPVLNAWFEDDTIRVAKQVNVGFAVAAAEGVLMPTVFEADRKPVTQIAEETAEMISLAREGKLRASLQTGATFTISNIGPAGIDAFNAIISPPQTAIVALGSVAERPVATDGRLEVRQTVHLTLTVDHRAVDGVDGAKFLAGLKKEIEGLAWPMTAD